MGLATMSQVKKTAHRVKTYRLYSNEKVLGAAIRKEG